MKYSPSFKFIFTACAGLAMVACSNHGENKETLAQNHPQVHAKHQVIGLEQLQRLARKGDSDAQYALGYRYYYGIGVPQNLHKSVAWLSQSASQGQSQANQALALIRQADHVDKQGLSAKKMTENVAKSNKKPASLVASVSDGFTLQLMGTHDKKSLIDFIMANNLQHKATYYRRSFDSQDWYVLVSGRFVSQNDALKAIDGLPTSVQKMHPWVKPLGLVKKEMQG